MGDIPHGWACAEFNLLMRDILFFEAAEDSSPHIFVAPGVMPHWLAGGGSIGIAQAPTIFSGAFGYRLTHDAAAKRVTIDISQAPPGGVRYVYTCRFGNVVSATSNVGTPTVVDRDIQFAAGTTHATVQYADPSP